MVIAPRSAIRNLPVGETSNSLGLAGVDALLKEIQSTLLRSQIAAKWSIVDFVFRKNLEETSTRGCPLCGFKASDNQFSKLRSHCIFGGGDLLRHICPACEVIYGPDKMFALTEAGLAEDYEWHYQVYQEGDSTERELRAFFALNPDKRGVYLNYGAGGWSRTVQELRAQGWIVYAYEPHISATHSLAQDWCVCSSEQLQLMRFDGIFSNNVLEHFRHPVQELQRMERLLHEGGSMAHATPCFEYLYEYTRFHLHFFTGKSKDLLMQLANLQLVEDIVDGDFICRVMKSSRQGECHA
ncbi:MULTISPECIES: methyltransferase domain-containing protein [unclassified Synechococcus]|nr:MULTISPECIES: methyltransferase domain-containing protein [unclassified Synechococcus]TWB91026.1 methyltransferase family protein [Synechococcus sp. Ace-Pa]